MKKILLLLVYLWINSFLSGCWDRVEINDLAIVTAAAIDEADDNQIELSLQVFIPKSLSSGGGKVVEVAEEENDIGRDLKKESICQMPCLSFKVRLPRKIFWGQCKVFIFGEKLAKKGIQEEMDFILRHPQPRERSYLYVSEGKAKSVLEINATLERYSAGSIRELSDLHIGMQVTTQDIDEMLIGMLKLLHIPIVKIEHRERERKYS